MISNKCPGARKGRRGYPREENELDDNDKITQKMERSSGVQNGYDMGNDMSDVRKNQQCKMGRQNGMQAEEVSRFLLFVLTDAADVAHLLVCFFVATICRGFHNVLVRKTLYVLLDLGLVFLRVAHH